MGAKVIETKVFGVGLIKSSTCEKPTVVVNITHMHIPAPKPDWGVLRYCLEVVVLVWRHLFAVSLHEELNIVPRLRDCIFVILLAVEGSHESVQLIRFGLGCVAGLGIQGKKAGFGAPFAAAAHCKNKENGSDIRSSCSVQIHPFQVSHSNHFQVRPVGGDILTYRFYAAGLL